VLDLSQEAHAHADRRLRSEQVAWLTTVRADGQPQSTPVWFLWDGETFLLYSQPGAQKVRNVTANPKVSLHLGDDGAATTWSPSRARPRSSPAPRGPTGWRRT
jgi:PPOX class probable F420-dependent enzyme